MVNYYSAISPSYGNRWLDKKFRSLFYGFFLIFAFVKVFISTSFQFPTICTLTNLPMSKSIYFSFIAAERKLRSIHSFQVGNAYCLFHSSTRVTTPTSAPKRANTWFTLSKRKVFLPCSNSRTKRNPTPARIANSGCVRRNSLRLTSTKETILILNDQLKFSRLVKPLRYFFFFNSKR